MKSWISMMLLTPIPWAQRVWALPFLTVLAPSERYHKERNMQHKTITDWAWQMILQVARWMPDRRLVVVADGTYAVLEFLLKVSRLPLVSAITRLRLDACVYDPAPVREAGKRGRHALKGQSYNPSWLRASTIPRRSGRPTRCPGMGEQPERCRSPLARRCGINLLSRSVGSSFAIHKASMSPWPCFAPIKMQTLPTSSSGLFCAGRSKSLFMKFVLIWASRRERQWSDLAIVRTTPALLALFSLVTIFAHQLVDGQSFPVRQAAWYSKALPTFSDTLAFVRQHLWPSTFFSVSSPQGDTIQIPRALFDRFVETLAFAA